MGNIEARLQNALQSIQDWTNRQTDPTGNPYVKEKSFYDSIANTPIENTKLASYSQTLADLDLLRMANKGLPMTRERMLPLVQGLMRGDAEAAEQDANIRNEQARRNLVSNVMQNISDVKNPGEYMGIMKLLEAAGGTKYNPAEMAYSFSTKDHANDNQLKGASTLAGIFGNLYSQEQQMALQREQMAMQERIAGMRGTGGRGGGLVDLNPKDAIKVVSDVNALIEKAAMTGKPEERLQIMKELVENAPYYELVSPGISKKIYNQAAYLYPNTSKNDKPQSRAREAPPSYLEDIANGKSSTGDTEVDELIRQLSRDN